MNSQSERQTIVDVVITSAPRLDNLQHRIAPLDQPVQDLVGPMIFAQRARASDTYQPHNPAMDNYLQSFLTLPDDTLLTSKQKRRRDTSELENIIPRRYTKIKTDQKQWAERTARNMHSIAGLQRQGLLLDTQPSLQRAREPHRQPTGWDQLLKDVINRQKEITTNARRKRAVAKKISRQVEKQADERMAQQGVYRDPRKAAKKEEERRKKLAKWTGKQVMARWLYVESVWREQQQMEEEEQRQREGKQVLAEMLDRSTRLLEDQQREMEGSDSEAEVPAEQSDVEFTSESSSGEDSETEMAALNRDLEIPMEELLSQYCQVKDQTDEEASSDDDGPGLAELAKMAQTASEHTVETPFLLRGTLREYQRQGLDWLVALYQRETNGILADEMGLGKTIQTIALLAYLACHQGTWGPHLIIVPTSVLMNWQQEFHRWLPGFKILSYFGSRSERKQKRQGWSKPNAFHVCITTYQLAIQDAAVFRRKDWCYMVLDEAQAIKNFRSQRWQTLLGVKTQRRLLLTGTPLQNSLIELWSLMYFLMPQEFDQDGGFAGLDRFREWFSQPLEKLLAAQGDTEHQREAHQAVLKLHAVLRPHILRRLKHDVETQLPSKTEHVIKCRLAKRQRLLYDDFMARSQTQQTLQTGSYLGVLGCLMQLRKVCNHPDLLETRPVASSWAMSGAEVAEYGRTEMLIRKMLGDSNEVPLVLKRGDGMACRSARRLDASPALLEIGLKTASRALDGGLEAIDTVRYKSVEANVRMRRAKAESENAGRWLRLADHNMARIHGPLSEPLLGEGLVRLCSMLADSSVFEYMCKTDIGANLVLDGQGRLAKHASLIDNFVFATPPVVVVNTDSDRAAVYPHLRIRTGYEPNAKDVLPNILHLHRRIHHQTGHLRSLELRQQIAFPEPFLLQYDCGKLQVLETLLRKLVAEGHRALIFTQMTRMLDILEQWLNLHGYRYLRLDGATKVEQRWRLTEIFNHDTRWKVFISSTRAGGLGINLTGADTVIFYDSDWNHAMDAQCQDRCHRIGQQREVHIYRLISERSVEEAIWRKQCEKRWLNQVIIQEGKFDPAYSTRQTRSSKRNKNMNAQLGVGDWCDLANSLLEQLQPESGKDNSRKPAITDREADRMLTAAEDEGADAEALKVAATEVAKADALDMGEEESTAPTGGSCTPMPIESTVEETVEDDGIGHIDDYMLELLASGKHF